MRRPSALVQSEGSKRKRAAPASWSPLVMVHLCVMHQSTSVSSILLPNQSRRAEFQPAVGRACFFSSSSVGFAAEVPSAGQGWAIIQSGQLSLDRRPLGGMRVESPGRGARRGAGGVRGSTCKRGGRQDVWSMPPELLCFSFEGG